MSQFTLTCQLCHIVSGHEPLYQRLVSRHKVWGEEWVNCKSNYFRHYICIYGLKDLEALALDNTALFINKLEESFDPFTYDCLQELCFNRTREEYMGVKGFDLNYYTRRLFVRHHF